jgi:hypothetical protein
MNPKGASVFVVPISAFKSLEACNKQGGPWLVHRQTHAVVFTWAVEISVTTELLYGLIGASYSFLHSFLERIERVFCLQSLA